MSKGYAKAAFQQLLSEQLTKMSAVEIGQRVGRPVSTIYKWLEGTQSPAWPQLLKACKALAIDPDLLKVDDVRFHDLWRRQHLSFHVMDRRFLDLHKDGHTFEAVLAVNVAGAILVRELSQQGHPMRMATSDLGDVSLVAAKPDLLLKGLAWRVAGLPELGLVTVLQSQATQSLLHTWVKLTSENVVQILKDCRKFQAS